MSSKNSLENKRLRRQQREFEDARKPISKWVQMFIPSKDKYGNLKVLPVIMPTSAFKPK